MTKLRNLFLFVACLGVVALGACAGLVVYTLFKTLSNIAACDLMVP